MYECFGEYPPEPFDDFEPAYEKEAPTPIEPAPECDFPEADFDYSQRLRNEAVIAAEDGMAVVEGLGDDVELRTALGLTDQSYDARINAASAIPTFLIPLDAFDHYNECGAADEDLSRIFYPTKQFLVSANRNDVAQYTIRAALLDGEMKAAEIGLPVLTYQRAQITAMILKGYDCIESS